LAPQLPQVPAKQILEPPQDWNGARHTLFRQQPLALAQVLPAQHGRPWPPHDTHVPLPLPLHTVAALLQKRLAQQGWPPPPQLTQTAP
jgi:hypothetical protein